MDTGLDSSKKVVHKAYEVIGNKIADVIQKLQQKMFRSKLFIYSVNKNIKLRTSMLKSGLSDYSDAYIDLKGTIDRLAFAAVKMIKLRKMLHLKIMLHLDQKLTLH